MSAAIHIFYVCIIQQHASQENKRGGMLPAISFHAKLKCLSD